MLFQTALQAAQEGGNFLGGLAPLLVVIAIIGGVIWYFFHCPSCNRVFTRELVKTEQNMLQKVLQSSEHRTYRCKNCDAEWTKKVHLGD